MTKKFALLTLPVVLIAAAGTLGFSGPAPAAPAPTAIAGGYTVDAVHSAVVFKIEHDGAGTFFGAFEKISGSFDLSGAAPALEFTVDVDSVDTNSADRDKHLKSPDFFNVKQFPTATFKSTKVTKTTEGAFEVVGDLTLHGVTKPVTVAVSSAKSKVSERTKKEVAGFEAVFSINRSEFDIKTYPGALGEKVTIMVGIEGAK